MSRLNKTRLVPIIGMLFLLSLAASATHTAAAAPTSGATGIIVPLYGYPDSDWSNLIWAKQVNPSVPMMAVVNPYNGPGSFQDQGFASGINRLEAAGVTVLGYVWTDYATRNIASVENDIAAYKNLYGVDGIYIDQMSNVPGFEWYYSSLTAYAKSLGMWMVVGNPGTSVPPSYVGTVSMIVVYENSGAPTTSYLSSQSSLYGKSGFAAIAYGIPSVNTGYLDTASNYVSYIYLTDGTMPNPYAPESSYLDNLATALQAYDSANSGPVETPGTISVTTVDQSGHEIWGMYTTLWQNGAVVQSCFSPCTLTVNGGQAYQVQVSNFGVHVFTSWGNGLQDNSFSVMEPSAATQLHIWAVYDA